MRVAIVGCGQLARMLALDGIPMGMQFSFLVEANEDPRCVHGLGEVVVATVDAGELYRQLGNPDVITVEKEQVDITLLESLQHYCTVSPNPGALSIFKNRLKEKQFLQSVGIPIAPFYTVESVEDLHRAIDQLQQPIFLKSVELGYDGYHQYQITNDNAKQVVESVTFPSHWVAEAGIAFDREVSFIAARDHNGNIVYYPAVENKHKNGTLLHSLAPAPNVSTQLESTGRDYLRNLLESTNYVGIMCVECFVKGEQLLVNEIAPRVHNSGHWTSKGAMTSQFENHLRAVTGLPLGSTQTYAISGMLNLLGCTLTVDQIGDQKSFVTLYGKTLKPGRKLGHVIVQGDSHQDVTTRLNQIEALAYS